MTDNTLIIVIEALPQNSVKQVVVIQANLKMNTTIYTDDGPLGPTYSWQNYGVVYICMFIWSTLYVFGRIYDFLDRYGNKYPILGDCSWWGRKTWFWGASAQDMPTLVLNGYEKYSRNGQVWGVWIFDRLFQVLPPMMMEEVRRLPPNKASFLGLVDGLFMWSAHTGKTLKERYHIAALKHLNQILPDMTERLSQETDIQLSKIAGRGDETARGWTVYNGWDTMLDLSFNLMGPFLIDSDLGRSQRFIHHARQYCATIPFWAALKFMLPPFLYGSSSWFLPPAWTVCKYLRKVQKMVVPEIQRRKLQTGATHDVLQSLLEIPNGLDQDQSDEEIVNQMLFVLFAGADLLGVVLCQLVYTIIAYPEYEQELLSEIAQAVDNCSGWNKSTISCMPKLDSFIREVLRINPPICCTVQRKVCEDLELSNGKILKAGDNVFFPTRAVLCDPDIYPDPDKFNPYRFLDQSGSDSVVHTATQTKHYSVFGYGQQSCPGRFYGILASKLVLAKLLLSYEMKFFPSRKGMPGGVCQGVQLAPNMDTFVAFRRRT
ncbi:unnamed protein product [Periconia digitata]|uniref:Cytochrome P450 n=1 Tax=Periconia digitata TaxID=1303443 RepID=A0A9W4UJX1_9PLEO|nr:unnamed protein product [Periconia digitata]